MLTFLFIPLLTSVFSASINSSAHPDRVNHLPGAPIEPQFPLYSGFLTAEDNGTEHKLFYVLAEAIRADPATVSYNPLIIWLNGGPGSSSLFGFLLIHGPYLLNAETGELRYNDFSWNQYANVLYLETPTGVGFSHSNDMNNLTYNDSNTARINRKALQDFMTRVHPRYGIRDFYIAGESYAGVYNPYFAREVLEHVRNGEFTNPNLKGIAMGNARTDDYTDTIATALQLYSLGMIHESNGKVLFDLWEKIIDGQKPTISRELEKELFNGVSIGYHAHYNLPLQCNKEANNSIWHVSKPVPNAECNPDVLIAAYLNREEVQIQMHVRTSNEPAVLWKLSSDDVNGNYTKESDTAPIYKDIIAAAEGNFRILFYTGDMDLMCPPLQVAYGARRIAEDNAMIKMMNDHTFHWTYLGDNGGARTSYATNDSRISVDVLTVRGASHMVPLTHPDRAFQLINNFITAEPKTQIDYSKMIPRRNS